MCTLVFVYRPDEDWPVMIGTNRDEMVDRPWLPPGRHWPDRPDVVAGKDETAGGSWLGVNDEGVLAAINNRVGTLGPEQNKRSRGELVLEALDHPSAAEAAEALVELDPKAYRPFNLVIADSQNAFWLRNTGAPKASEIDIFEVPQGLSMLTAQDLNDFTCPRIRGYLPKFRDAPLPDPGNDDWSSWEHLFASRGSGEGSSAEDAMWIVTERGFNTLSSSMIALPSAQQQDTRTIWRFAIRYPHAQPYTKMEL